MKSWTSIGRFAACLLAIMLFGLPAIALAAVGRTVGTYQVSPTGAATYTIPIWAPRGPNGLEPHVSLTYNSRSGAGYLGVGWSISGLSSIYRCARTYAQDGAPARIALTTSDGFCMDGQRLRLTGGTYGEAGSTYQTEVANFSLVKAYGAAGNGPAYFEVQSPDGLTYEYGNGGNSRVLADGSTAWIWSLDEVTDRAGNTMVVSYDTSSGYAVPASISWTPISPGAGTYSYAMLFAYGTNQPQSSIYGYVGGAAVSDANLLQSISVEYSNTTVKKYVLSYQQSPTTGRDELAQVQECADSGATNCLAPTHITYQTGGPGVSPTSEMVSLGGTASYHVAGYDLNGDGYKDLVYQLGTTWYVAFGSSNGYGSPINTGVTTPTYADGKGYLLVGDLLGTGKDGLLANSNGTWYYYTWNGSSFAGVSTDVPFDSIATAFALADTNGDGLPDLVSLELNGGGTNIPAVYIRLNASGGGTLGFSAPYTAFTAGSTGDAVTYGALRTADTQYAVPIRRLDFNGDGRDDLIMDIRYYESATRTHYSSEFQLLANGATFQGPAYGGAATDNYFLNWNDDGCTDYIQGTVLYLSACNGTPGQSIQLNGTPIGIMSWDGSGREDILYQSGGNIYVQLSNGSSLGAAVLTPIEYNSSASYMGADIDGDGLDDLLTWTPTTIWYNLHSSAGQTPDLLSSVTDGYGNFAKPTYVSIANALNSSYFPSTDAQFPYENYIGPIYVVNQTTFNDPSSPPNGTFQRTDTYYGAWMNLQGRGFSGFNEVQSHDSRNGLWDALLYDRKFPYTGLLVWDDLTQDEARTMEVRSAFNNRTYTTLDSTPGSERYFVYFNNMTVVNFDAIGGKLSTVSTDLFFDNYGNPKQIATTTTDNASGSPFVGDTWTKTTTNTPDVDTSTWCLRLSSESQISYTESYDDSSVLRIRDYTPDLTHCRYTQIVTAPSGSYEVTEALGYDDFGNVNSDSITGAGMSARVTSANWGTTGQFPMSVTDATNATTQFDYDFSYGLVSSQTDPNGLTTSWQYGDGFGRLTQETRPDGTYTTYTYDNCANAGGCLLGANTLAVSHFDYNVGGSIETDGTIYYDELERPITWNDMTLSGTQWNRNEVRYDSLGRLVKQAAPCIWSGVTSTCPYWTTISYDLVNRPAAIERPISQSDSTLQTTSYTYAGDTTTITDPNENTRTLIHDPNGWLRQTRDAMGYEITLGYDAAGAKTSVTDNLANGPSNPLWTGTYAYGIAPFLIGETDVDRGDWGYTVDALGERTAWTDAKGQHFSETYDALSRPHTRTEPDLFTQWTWGSSAASHDIGKLASVCTGTGSACSASNYAESESYDTLGRLSQRSITLPAMGTYAYTWQYNGTTGLLDTLTYPVSTSGQSLKLKYAYQSGMLQSITDVLDSPNVTIWQTNTKNAAGQITQETLGNGLVTSRAYDAVTHWLASVQSGPGGGASIQNQSFLYDEVGNVTQRQNGNLGLSENFYYDSDNRLSYSTLNGTQNLSLSYDSMGNITSKSDIASGASWTYDPTHVHRVTQAGSASFKYAYDANGNMTSWKGNAITWTSYNYPLRIPCPSATEIYTYGPDRTPWLDTFQSSTTTNTYHLGNLMEIVVGGSGTTYRHYIYAGQEPVAIDERTSSSNAFYYLLTDHQGSISGITDSSGKVAVNESFHPYGNRRNPSTWTDPISTSDLNTIAGITPRGYTFKPTIEYTGLNNLGGRVEDALTGRFLSADPYISDPTDPQSFNRYSYVANNPLTYTDPTGFIEFVPGTSVIPGGITITGLPEPDGTPDAAAQLEQSLDNAINDWARGTFEGGTASSAQQNGCSDAYVCLSQKPKKPQQSNPPTVPNLPQVTITPGPPVAPQPSWASSFVFNWFVEPWFGWVDCAGNRCSSGETAWRFVRGPVGMAGGVVGGKLLAPVASAAGTALANAEAKTGPVAALSLLMRLAPQATVPLAEAMDVEGASQVELSIQLEDAEELMSETSPVEEAATHGGH